MVAKKETAQKSLSYLEEIQKDVCRVCTDDVMFLPTGVTLLDMMMGGGLPLGQFVELYGKDGVGKTLMLIMFAKAAQDAGGCAIILDLERKFPLVFARDLGVNIDPNSSTGLVVAEPETAEEAGAAFELAVNKYANSEFPVFIGWDSLSSTGPEEIGEAKGTGNAQVGIRLLSKDKQRVGALAKFYTSLFCFRQPFKRMRNTNIVLVGTSQMRANIGVAYGEVETTPGGHAIRHAAVARLALKAKWDLNGGRVDGKKTGDHDGYWLHVKMAKNQHAPPGRECYIPMWFSSGADDILACLTYLQFKGELGMYINGFFDWEGKKYRKGQLLELAYNEPTVAARIVEATKDLYYGSAPVVQQ